MVSFSDFLCSGGFLDSCFLMFLLMSVVSHGKDLSAARFCHSAICSHLNLQSFLIRMNSSEGNCWAKSMLRLFQSLRQPRGAWEVGPGSGQPAARAGTPGAPHKPGCHARC